MLVICGCLSLLGNGFSTISAHFVEPPNSDGNLAHGNYQLPRARAGIPARSFSLRQITCGIGSAEHPIHRRTPVIPPYLLAALPIPPGRRRRGSAKSRDDEQANRRMRYVTELLPRLKRSPANFMLACHARRQNSLGPSMRDTRLGFSSRSPTKSGPCSKKLSERVSTSRWRMCSSTRPRRGIVAADRG
jgi:hypothetical protein